MLKSLTLIATFSATSVVFIVETAFSRPFDGSNKYPIVPNSDSYKLVCFMQTAENRTLNLESLCRDKNANTQPQIIISDLKDNGEIMLGRVVNKTGQTTNFIKVNYEILDSDGNLIGQGSTYTDPPTLSSGQSAAFQISLPGGGNIRTTSVEWDK